jgi:hypothetical protein
VCELGPDTRAPLEQVLELTREAATRRPGPGGQPGGMSGQQARYAGELRVQYGGKGKFSLVWGELLDGQLSFKEGGAEGRLLRTASVRGGKVGSVKKARKGHPHTLRLDLAQPDSQGASKHVLSVASPGLHKYWTTCITMDTAPPSASERLAAAAATPSALSQRPQPLPSNAGNVSCQYGGKGAFEPVWLEVRRGALTVRENECAAATLRTASVLGCVADTPKKSRKGHEHALRIDLAQPDSVGEAKMLVSVASQRELFLWRECLSAYRGMSAEQLAGLLSDADAMAGGTPRLPAEAAAAATVQVRQRMQAAFGDVEIGSPGGEGSTSARMFDFEPMVR